MSLGTAHSLVLALTLSLALLCVLLGNVLPAASYWALLVPWYAAWRSCRGRYWPVWAGSLLALAAVVAAAWLLLRGGLPAALPAACAALLGICVARLVTRQTPAHDLHSLVLSLLMVFAGTVLNQHLSYGVLLVAYTVSVTWALVTRQFVHGAAMQAYRSGDQAAYRRTLARRDVATLRFFGSIAGVGLLILLGTSLVFVAFPRVGLGALRLGGGADRQFPGDVSLAAPPRAGGDDTLVARVFGLSHADFLRGVYMRGSIYDAAHIAGFSASEALLGIRPARLALADSALAQPASTGLEHTSGLRTYDVFLQPIGETILLAAGFVDRVEPSASGRALLPGAERLGVGPSGELVRTVPGSGAVRYRVTGSLSQVPPHPLDRPAMGLPAAGSGERLPFSDGAFEAHFLAAPQQLDPRVAPLARQIVGAATSFSDKAGRLRRYLLDHYGYSLSQTNSLRADPLAGFLFDDKRGHCEYFATAMAILLRAVGVPSRVVGGFEGGIWDPQGESILFTAAHAHAWVEWYQPGAGWLADDSTPYRPAAELAGAAAWLERLRRIWDDQIVDFGLDEQLTLWRGIVGALQPASLTAGGIASVWQLPWRAVLGALALCGGGCGLVWFVRRLLATSEQLAPPQSQLTRDLVRAIERLGGRRLPATQTLRQAVHGLMPDLPAAAAQTLAQALALYEQGRFAAQAAPPQRARALCKALKSLRA